MVTFPCRPIGANWNAVQQGLPERADHCECGNRQRVFRGHDECATCGHLPEHTIRSSWESRARQLRLNDAHAAVGVR